MCQYSCRDRLQNQASPRLAGAPERLLVHPGEHQHAAAAGVLHDRGHQLARRQILTSIPPPSAPPSARAAARAARARSRRRSRPRLPPRTPSARCAASPAPPEAITGTLDGLRERARERQVVARARAVGVDRRHEHLAGAALDRLLRPVDGVAAARVLARVRHDLAGPGVDRADNGLRAELVGEPGEDRRVVEGGAVDGDLVRAGAQQRPGVLEARDAAADGERDRQLVGGALDQLQRSGRGPRGWP